MDPSQYKYNGDAWLYFGSKNPIRLYMCCCWLSLNGENSFSVLSSLPTTIQQSNIKPKKLPYSDTKGWPVQNPNFKPDHALLNTVLPDRYLRNVKLWKCFRTKIGLAKGWKKDQPRQEEGWSSKESIQRPSCVCIDERKRRGIDTNL